MKFKKSLDKILEKTLILIMSILVIDVLWQVLSRYILSSPSSFTDELAGFLLIWVGILGAAYVAGQRQHLAIDLLIQKSSETNRAKLYLFINICIALFAVAVMMIGGAWLAITRFQFDVTSAALRIPLGYVYLVMPLSGLLILYYSIYLIIHPKENLQ
ncbi:TRAP transporter small permease [Saccharicrinis fermentans]|uniref:Neu5Ac permease n=1 Tax=Saccharicrinis fermentans DSM 9555 = JCM 21142 TaxID=869213 RepID=W7Y9E8_9BACT|nr:TRAP transporter small permease [Saccharicrinis fermentans]GAF04972.1 Neu5Ac permease [Saccharicrinis fermentans DSM 9555 = JCM 21142]